MDFSTPMSQSQPAQVPVWDSHTAEEDDLDEPPELRLQRRATKAQFQRTTIRKPSEHSSLLTQAIMKQSDDDGQESSHTILRPQRRRSVTSNVSLASTADLTSDTGLTSPCRTNTPSPPVPEMAMHRLHADSQAKSEQHGPTTIAAGHVAAPLQQEPPKETPRKRCIQFACGKPNPPKEQTPVSAPMVKAPSAQEQPRRSCIRFACPPRPSSTQNTPPRDVTVPAKAQATTAIAESPSTPRKSITIASAVSPSRPSPATRRLSNKSPGSRPKYLRANSKDLVKDGSQFHEFASGLPREDDWIRQDSSPVRRKLTINDTLTKEINFRRLAVEAEEEEEAERKEREGIPEEDEDEENEDEDDDEEEDEDDELDYEEDDEDSDDFDDSDGYYTDEETGFAESDEEEDDEVDGMRLWTPSAGTVTGQVSSIIRRTSVDFQLSDSSIGSMRRVKIRHHKQEEETPDLPDSTDFVCGTLDEDRPLEEAYLSNLAARRNEKLRVIPQDIDPSFPTSEPDDDDEDAGGNSDTAPWVQGEMEDLHHGGRRRSEQASPRKYHSPPPARRHRSPPPPKAAAKVIPKRLHSPPPKGRCPRSPTRLFDARSPPRRMRSPAPRVALTTPIQSPRQGANVKFNLAGRPGMITTKSLPRPAAMFGQLKHRYQKNNRNDDIHVRGAIDIVKGLEKKRQRRTEKFYQKYCNRARRGQIPERKPQPGKGAERMKELGLLMAGKKDQGNYVLSI